ncbi:MAG TPA: PepSY domain-containing protein [Nitrososphaera sp.]|nr:PepSY domain-containing protein [Nitrososphaera sp.]
MRKMMYAILAVPVITALAALVVLFPASFAGSAIAGSQVPAQINNQVLEQENNGAGEEEEDDVDGTEDDVEENVDSNLANQAKITADDAKVIASNHLSVDTTAVQFIELEQEGGQLIYSVELIKGNQQMEVEVDAFSGDVVSVEQEDD